MTECNHREACQTILTELFGLRRTEFGVDHDSSPYISQNDTKIAANGPISKNKVLYFSQDSLLM